MQPMCIELLEYYGASFRAARDVADLSTFYVFSAAFPLWTRAVGIVVGMN